MVILKCLVRLAKRLIVGEISDPLTQNFMIYTLSYALSAVLSSIPYIGLFQAEDIAVISADISFLQSFIDCTLPVTVTLTLGTMIQNFAQARVLRAFIFWPGIICFFYVFLYISLRQQHVSKEFYIVSFVVLCILTIFNLIVISMVEAESKRYPSINK